MTPNDILKSLEEIQKYADEDDDESAHSAEDSLYVELLESISNDKCTDPKTCARLVLESNKMKFNRWCA